MTNHTPAVYRVEFGPAWPVPPITLPYTDPNVFHRAVAAHAAPHLATKLAELGRPEFADCFFKVNEDLTAGEFWWLDLAAGRGARFCPARISPAVPAATSSEETHVVADDSDDPEHIDDCPGCNPAS